MRFSILFPAIVALAGCSQSNETSISPATSLQPLVASSTEPDPEKVERLINDFVEACIVRNDGQPAADPMRPNSTVRYLRERGYNTGLADPDLNGGFSKVYAEDKDNWCGSGFEGVSAVASTAMDRNLRNTTSIGYSFSKEHIQDGVTYKIYKEQSTLDLSTIRGFELSLFVSNGSTILSLVPLRQ